MIFFPPVDFVEEMESLDLKTELNVTVKIEIKSEPAQLKQEPSDFQLVDEVPSHIEFDEVRSQTGTTWEPEVFNSEFESFRQEEILGLPRETVDEWESNPNDQSSNPEHDVFKQILDFDENVDSKRGPLENSGKKLFECRECGKRFIQL